MDFEKLADFFLRAEDLSNNWTKTVVLAGDFNARLGEDTNDHFTNERGVRLRDEILADIPLRIIQSSRGRYTTRTAAGAGVTDLIITNYVGRNSMEIHEEEHLGWSDHRPVLWEFETNFTLKTGFSRWNIRKLAEEENRASYKHEIYNNVDSVERHLQQIENLPQDNQNQQQIDLAWDEIKSWIEKAAAVAVGVFHFRPSTNRDFWTAELEAEYRRVEAEVEALNFIRTTTRSPAVRQGTVESIRRLRGELRAKVKDRRTETWTAMVNKLGDRQNAAHSRAW